MIDFTLCTGGVSREADSRDYALHVYSGLAAEEYIEAARTQRQRLLRNDIWRPRPTTFKEVELSEPNPFAEEGYEYCRGEFSAMPVILTGKDDVLDDDLGPDRPKKIRCDRRLDERVVKPREGSLMLVEVVRLKIPPRWDAGMRAGKSAHEIEMESRESICHTIVGYVHSADDEGRVEVRVIDYKDQRDLLKQYVGAQKKIIIVGNSPPRRREFRLTPLQRSEDLRGEFSALLSLAEGKAPLFDMLVSPQTGWGAKGDDLAKPEKYIGPVTLSSIRRMHEALRFTRTQCEMVESVVAEVQKNAEVEEQGKEPEKPRKPMIIWGPPGTGKTELSVQAAKSTVISGSVDSRHARVARVAFTAANHAKNFSTIDKLESDPTTCSPIVYFEASEESSSASRRGTHMWKYSPSRMAVCKPDDLPSCWRIPVGRDWDHLSEGEQEMWKELEMLQAAAAIAMHRYKIEFEETARHERAVQYSNGRNGGITTLTGAAVTQLYARRKETKEESDEAIEKLKMFFSNYAVYSFATLVGWSKGYVTRYVRNAFILTIQDESSLANWLSYCVFSNSPAINLPAASCFLDALRRAGQGVPMKPMISKQVRSIISACPPRRGREVMVGDPAQQCAFTLACLGSGREILMRSPIEVFCRLPNSDATLLETVFRMTKPLFVLVNAMFYHGRLQYGRVGAGRGRPTIGRGGFLGSDSPVVVFDTRGEDFCVQQRGRRDVSGSTPNRPLTTSSFSDGEAHACLFYARCYVESHTWRFTGAQPWTIRFITSYKAQELRLNELVRACPILSRLNVIVRTSRSMQGEEGNLIVHSPVVTRRSHSLISSTVRNQHLADIQALTVTLSRAKDILCVVGDVNYLWHLEDNTKWASLIQRALYMNAVYPASLIRPPQLGQGHHHYGAEVNRF